jgi:hypothetical protein
MTAPSPPPGPPPAPGWQNVGPSGRFYQVALPMSHEAIRLHGEPIFVFYGEFDTDLEPDVWDAFLKDPLKMLKNEQVTLPSNGNHFGIRILKLEDTEGGPDEEYVEAVTNRNQTTVGILGQWTLAEEERGVHVTTTVINHERPLNPRIGITF